MSSFRQAGLAEPLALGWYREPYAIQVELKP